MNKALIDTDILSELIKGIDPIVAGNATAYRQTYGRYTTSAITVMEIIRGFQRVQSPQRIARFLQSFRGEEILSFDQAAAQLAGEISGELERTGQTIGFADPMIAAIAFDPRPRPGEGQHRSFRADCPDRSSDRAHQLETVINRQKEHRLIFRLLTNTTRCPLAPPP